MGVMKKPVPSISPISSWADLASMIEQCSDGTWVFRGEPSADHTLQPKAGRVGSYRGAARKTAYDPREEKAALELFKLQARPYLGHSPASEMEWLAIAQHHGMSTRLLDWTESLLVAAYFAVEQAGTRGEAVIYGVRGLGKVNPRTSPFHLRTPAVYHPPHITPRIPAQRSVFTVHPNPTVPFAPNGLVRWVVSANACGNIKRILDACAINESSLFPDLDGLSRYLGWRYKWGKL